MTSDLQDTGGAGSPMSWPSEADLRAEVVRLKAALESLRDQCSQQRADWLKESRGAPSKMLQASCAMAAGSFGTVLEWVEDIINGKPKATGGGS